MDIVASIGLILLGIGLIIIGTQHPKYKNRKFKFIILGILLIIFGVVFSVLLYQNKFLPLF